MTTDTFEALAAYRRLRENGTIGDLLARMGADPEAVERESANIASSDATTAEAYVLGLLVGANAANAIAIIMEVSPTGPTHPTGRRTRPGLRRRRSR